MYFGFFIDYFAITFTQNLKWNWNRYLKYSKGILGQISHFPLVLFTWFPPMPWQLKNPTFSFSLRPMLSKHWLVSTFLIWGKERGEIFLKIFPGPARFVQKIAICEQITFPNSQGMNGVGWKQPQSSSWSGTSLTVPSHEGIQECYSVQISILSLLFVPENNKTSTWEMHFEACCCSPLISIIFPWIWAQEEPPRAGHGSFMA